MIDLHLHLDGSLSEEDFRFLANLKGIDLGKDFPNNMHVDENCNSLEEYLQKFDMPLKLLQDEFSLCFITKSLVKRLYAMGYIYAEIRFAPCLHTKKGMSQNNAVLAVLTGLNSGLKETPGFNANIILCCMRQASPMVNMETIRVAEKFKDRKVVAVDLAGPEALYTGDYYKKIFDYAHNKKLNIIIHAGEACGSDEVMRAINLLNAKRIGHGVHLECTRENIKTINEKQIGFEFCPTSNLQTKSLSCYEEVPLSEFLGYGIKISINSDNMTVSNTDIFKEFRHLNEHFPLKWFEIKMLLDNAADIAFVDLNEKMRIKREITAKFNWFYEEITK